MKTMAQKVLKSNLGPVLDTLEEEELSEEEAELVLAEALEEMNTPTITYKDEIDFNNEEELQADFVIARKMIMQSMDKSNKISSLVFDALAVDTTNLIYLQLASETIRTNQVGVKALTDLFNSYHKLISTKKRNTLLDGEVEEVEEVPGLTTGKH